MVLGALAAAALAAGCTMKNQEAPPLSGPSELGTSIVIAVTPDRLQLDGSSQSLVTITARDSNGNPLRNLSLQTEIFVDGVRTDFGTLSARNLVTDANGRATLVFTAPPAPAGPAVDTNTVVTIAVTPLGSDFGNSFTRTASIRLVPVGNVVPADGLQPRFTFTPAAPTDNQAVLFDASTSSSPTNNPITSITWDFGDGTRDSGTTVSHSFRATGTFVVTMTVADAFNRTASISQQITVGPGTNPTAAFTTSPAAPRVGEQVNFNAAASRPAPGRTIRSYDWDFGDGTTGSGVTAQHSYSRSGTFTVTLVVTDDAGRFSTATGTVTAGLVTVPNVVNFTPAAAALAFSNVGLTSGPSTTAASATVPAGSIISQSPLAGALVTPGTPVSIVVSSGPPPVPVP